MASAGETGQASPSLARTVAVAQVDLGLGAIAVSGSRSLSDSVTAVTHH